MVASQELLSALIVGGVSLALFIGVAGVRRIPWRHATVMGVGFFVVFSALWVALFQGAQPILVIVGALGGSLVQRGYEQGERERIRISETIISGRSSPSI